MIQQKQDFLDNLKRLQPNMLVMWRDHTNPDKQLSWEGEKVLSQLTEHELEEVNLRKQFPNEIIIDIEDKYRLEEIKQKLSNKKLNFEIWDTGSRGLHFSIKFKNMEGLEVDVRNRIRRYLIEEMRSDLSLSNEKQWIAMEYSQHFKTGKIKTLMEFVGQPIENLIPESVIDYCRKSLQPQQKIIQKDEDFKDYLKDPYLNYVLTHTIKEGDRNNILFKNIALGLVKCGLTHEEILKIASQIVNNCPGKHLNEFMGWVEKAKIGMITEYNKAEIVNWAERYQHPLLYNLFKEIDVDNIMNVKMLWDLIWDRRIACQDVWKDLCFYNMLSVIVEEKEDDLRINPIISSESGSGKDEGINLVREVLDLLEFKTAKPSEVTDRTLIGAVNQYQVEINTKKPDKQKDAKELGLLASMDWIAFGESESVFKPGVHNQRLQLILRQAMDKTRRVEKGVSGELLDLHTNTVFIFSTFPMDNIITKLLDNGLFQRCLYYNKTISKEERGKILSHINRKLYDKTWSENFNEKQYMSLLCEKLKMIRVWYNENKHKLLKFGNMHKYIDDLWAGYTQEQYVLLDSDVGMLHTIIRRSTINLEKLVKLNVISKMKPEITKEDADEVFVCIRKCLNSIKDLLGKINSAQKQMWVLLMLLKNGSKTTMTIHNELKEKCKGMSSPNLRSKLINRVKEMGFISEIPDGKFTMLMLTSKGMEEIDV